MGTEFLLSFKIRKREIETIIIPIQVLIDKFSFIKTFPNNAAKIGEIDSKERVFLVPMMLNDFI